MLIETSGPQISQTHLSGNQQSKKLLLWEEGPWRYKAEAVDELTTRCKHSLVPIRVLFAD